MNRTHVRRTKHAKFEHEVRALQKFLRTNGGNLFSFINRVDFSSLVFSSDRRCEVRESDSIPFCIVLKRNGIENLASLELEPFTVAFSCLNLGSFFWWSESHDVNRKKIG